MSNTNEILKHIITAPELNSTEYANNLKGVFDNINDNFVTLANRDFVKGERGSSVEIVEYDIFDNTLEEPNYTEYGNLLINAIKNRPGYSKNNEYITSNNVTVSLFDNLGSKAGKLKMICNITSEDGVNFSYLPVSSLYYVFLDGRFANDKINKMDESVFTDIEDLSCVLIYNVNENGEGYFEVLDNAFPTIYYEKEVGLCWKLNGNNTGIPVKGPQGKAGENAKLYIVKSDKEINQSTSNTFEIEITHIFDTNGFTAINDYIKNNTDILKINTQYACAIYCNLGSGYNYYFGTLKYDNNKVIAISDSTIGIDTLVQLSTLENLFKNINLKNNDGYNVKGIYLPIEKQGYTQKVHLLTASSISNTEGNDTELNTDIIWSPVSDINTLKIDDSNKLQVDKYLYLKIDTELLTEKLKDVYNNETVTDDFVRIIKNAFKHRNNILKYKLVNVINPNVNDGSIVGSNVFGNYTNNNNVSLNTNNTLNLNGSASAKCLINTKINSYNASGEISDSSEPGPVIDITNLKNYGKHINTSKDENENTLVHEELEYTDFNNFNVLVYPIGVSKKDEVIGENTTVTPKLLTKENVKEYTVYEVIENIDNYLDRYSNMPFEFGDLIFNNDPNKKGIYRWVLDFTYNEFDPKELKESPSGTSSNILKNNKTAKDSGVYNNIFVDDGGASKNINALNIYALFNTIFTTSISPIESDNILWFNGIFKKLTIKGDEYLSNSVEGWELNPDIFKFYKFNPAFNNSYSINQDTSLNLNYNVNITGDKINSKKNLNVLGNITGENLQIFGNANIDKIENIYTGNDIIGDNGIKIGKNTENDSYYTEINSVGVVKCSDIISNKITSDKIESDKIEHDKIESDSITSENISINNEDISINNDSDCLKIEYKSENTPSNNHNPNISLSANANTIQFAPNKYSNIKFHEFNESINNSIDKTKTKIFIQKNDITEKSDTQTINRLCVNNNKSYKEYNDGKNSGLSGSGYGYKGHASGPHYSHWISEYWNDFSNNIGKLNRRDRYYRYTLFPYWDILTNPVTLMSTPVPTNANFNNNNYRPFNSIDAPYITNICQVKIPLYKEYLAGSENSGKSGYLNGIYLDGETLKIENNINSTDYSIKIKLNDKNFTFFTGLWHRKVDNDSNGAKMINTTDYPSNVYLTAEVSFCHKDEMTEVNVSDIYPDLKLTEWKRKKYEFPTDIIDTAWYGYTSGGPKTVGSPKNSRTIKNIEHINQYNIKFEDVDIDYYNILKNFIDYVNDYEDTTYIQNCYINIKLYTETVVSFQANAACMGECWLTPVLYYTDKNSDEYKKNKPIGITEETDWNNISLKPTLYQVSGQLKTSTTNTDAPWMSFDYLDKLCDNIYNQSGGHGDLYGPLDVPYNQNNSDPYDDEYYLNNGFNGYYNGNNFNVDITYKRSKSINNDTTHNIDINSNGIILNNKGQISGIKLKFHEKDSNNEMQTDNSLCLFRTIPDPDDPNNNIIEELSFATIFNYFNDLENSSLLTYGV